MSRRPIPLSHFWGWSLRAAIHD